MRVILLALCLATTACSGPATPARSAIIAGPTAKGTSESVRPATSPVDPTADPSPTPTTTAAPSPLKSVLDVKFVKTSAKGMTEAISAAYATSPDAGSIDIGGFTLSHEQALDLAERCEHGEPGDTGNIAESDRVANCSGLIRLMHILYRMTGHETFFTAAAAVFNYGRTDIIELYQPNFLELVTDDATSW